MTKFCPIIRYQKQYSDKIYCIEETCAFWDEERGQCCIKSLMIAAARAKAEVAIAEAGAAKEYIEEAANDFCTEETFRCDEQIEKLFKSVQEEIIKIALKNEILMEANNRG